MSRDTRGQTGNKIDTGPRSARAQGVGCGAVSPFEINQRHPRTYAKGIEEIKMEHTFHLRKENFSSLKTDH